VSLRPIFDRLADLIGSGDLDGITSQYALDAILLRFDSTFVGREAIRQCYSLYLAKKPKFLEIIAYTDSQEMLSYRAAIEIEGRRLNSYGMWIVKEGVIWRQFEGLARDP